MGGVPHRQAQRDAIKSPRDMADSSSPPKTAGRPELSPRHSSKKIGLEPATHGFAESTLGNVVSEVSVCGGQLSRRQIALGIEPLRNTCAHGDNCGACWARVWSSEGAF